MGDPRRLRRISSCVLAISVEHAIGMLKCVYPRHSTTEEELVVMRALKRTLDPRGILPPGKVFEIAAK